jgi:hypothetical protein
MILGWLRLAFFGMIGLTIVYFLVGIYARSVRREALEREWDSDPANEGGLPSDRAAHIDAGMAEFETGLKKRLLLLIYVVPVLAVIATAYAINWS